MTYKYRTFDADFKVLDTGIEATQVNTNTIAEKTAESGVTVDGVLLKDGVVKDSTGTQLSTLQDIQNASADKASYYCLSNHAIGSANNTPLLKINGDFSFFLQCKIDSIPAGSVQYKRIFSVIQTGNNGLLLFIDNVTNTFMFGHMTSGIVYPSAFSTPVPVPTGKIISLVITRVGTLISLYINGVLKGTLTNTNYVTYTADTSYSLFWNDALLGVFGNIHKSAIFNYALPADKIARYSAGAKLDFEDVGGSMTELVTNGTFTGNATGWSLTGYAYNSNNIKVTGSTPFSRFSQTIQFVKGKKYRITYDVVSNENSRSLYLLGSELSSNSPIGDLSNLLISSTVGTGKIFEFTCTGTGFNNTFGIGNNSTVDYGSSTGLVIDNVSIIQLGSVLDLEPENITDALWVDASPNGLHGTVTGALAINTEASGSWTPQGNNITFQSATGSYTKIGKLVYLSCDITLPTTSDTSDLHIKNLPFTQVNGGVASSFSTGYTDQGAINCWRVDPNDSKIVAISHSGTTITNNNYSNKRIILSGVIRL